MRFILIIDGKEVNVEAYSIKDNIYFKLRDVAKLLSGTKKQFDVAWDSGSRAIKMTCGKEYLASGGELTLSGTRRMTVYSPSQPAIILDGNKIILTAYTIDNNHWFKLRDIAAAINFSVAWDASANGIRIDTGKGYEQP